MGDDRKVRGRGAAKGRAGTPVRGAGAAKGAVQSKELVHGSSDLFFKGRTPGAAGKPEIYSLPDEFRKTRKNRNYTVYVAVVLFLAFLVTLAVLLTGWLQRTNGDPKVSIEDFKGINLGEVLSTARKTAGKLEALLAEIGDLKRERDQKVGDARERGAKERDMLAIAALPPENRRLSIEDSKKREDAQVRALAGQYDPRIQAKEREAAALRREVEAREKELSAGAKRGQDLIESFQKLHALELQKQREKYEQRVKETEERAARDRTELRAFYQRYIDSVILRYNPRWSDVRFLSVLADRAGTDAPADFAPRELERIVAAEDVAAAAAYGTLVRLVGDQRYLAERLAETGYTNSVDPALRRIAVLGRGIAAGYQALWTGLAGRLAERVVQVALYRAAVDALAKETREHGYVIGKGGDGRWLLVVSDRFPAKAGDTAYVIRAERRAIATLTLAPARDGLWATAASVAAGEEIRPFDKILLRVE